MMAGDQVLVKYRAVRYKSGRPVEKLPRRTELVELGRGLLPVGMELCVASRMAVNSTAR